MRLDAIATCFAAALAAVSGLSLPDRDSVVVSGSRQIAKRRGGGGGGGGGRGGGGGGGGRSSSSSGGGGGASSVGRGSPSSNAGGATRQGSGTQRTYGGGGYYGGGAAVPYSAGQRSTRGITPFLLPVAALAIFPGLWLYGVYAYNFDQPYTFHNASAVNASNPNGANETRPVQCLCQQYSVCGCDRNDDSSYLDGIIGNGSYDGLNKTLIQVADVNGTKTILLNGTLPNGTTAPGGDEDANAASGRVSALEHSGWWLTAAIVLYTVLSST